MLFKYVKRECRRSRFIQHIWIRPGLVKFRRFSFLESCIRKSTHLDRSNSRDLYIRPSKSKREDDRSNGGDEVRVRGGEGEGGGGRAAGHRAGVPERVGQGRISTAGRRDGELLGRFPVSDCSFWCSFNFWRFLEWSPLRDFLGRYNVCLGNGCFGFEIPRKADFCFLAWDHEKWSIALMGTKKEPVLTCMGPVFDWSNSFVLHAFLSLQTEKWRAPLDGSRIINVGGRHVCDFCSHLRTVQVKWNLGHFLILI